jgi:Pyruvate-formate lyase-activating enzyme
LKKLCQLIDAANVNLKSFDDAIYRSISGTPKSFVEIDTPSIPNTSFHEVAWGDYDNDNDLDLLLQGTTSASTKLFKQHG